MIQYHISKTGLQYEYEYAGVDNPRAPSLHPHIQTHVRAEMRILTLFRLDHCGPTNGLTDQKTNQWTKVLMDGQSLS